MAIKGSKATAKAETSNEDTGVRARYAAADLPNNKEQFTMLALLGFVGLGGLHRLMIAVKVKDVQQAFLGAIYLLPAILVGLLFFTAPPGVGFKLWYLAPLVLTYMLTIHDLVSMERLLSGELSAKKAWYETWPGRIGALVLLPVGLWFLYTKTNIPKKQKDSIAGVMIAIFVALAGASFTGVEEANKQAVKQEAEASGLYETCDQAREAGEETPIMADSDKYAAWLDRDRDGLACE